MSRIAPHPHHRMACASEQMGNPDRKPAKRHTERVDSYASLRFPEPCNLMKSPISAERLAPLYET